MGHKMKTWYYGDEADERLEDVDDYSYDNEESFDNMEEVYGDDYPYEDMDARLVGTSVICAFMMLCMVVCVGKRFVFAQKKKELKKRIMDTTLTAPTSEGYVTLQETDAF